MKRLTKLLLFLLVPALVLPWPVPEGVLPDPVSDAYARERKGERRDKRREYHIDRRQAARRGYAAGAVARHDRYYDRYERRERYERRRDRERREDRRDAARAAVAIGAVAAIAGAVAASQQD